MAHKIPELHEILALEARVHADKYDVYPIGISTHPIKAPKVSTDAFIESSLLRDILYIKKS